MISNLFSFPEFEFKSHNALEYYKKKFENIKRKARQRDTFVKKQLETGGGQLSKAEQRIVKSPAYSDLATKLGISAFGNEPRTDCDGDMESPVAPTRRLNNALNSSTGM